MEAAIATPAIRKTMALNDSDNSEMRGASGFDDAIAIHPGMTHAIVTPTDAAMMKRWRSTLPAVARKNCETARMSEARPVASVRTRAAKPRGESRGGAFLHDGDHHPPVREGITADGGD